jgi:hypothetical protein
MQRPGEEEVVFELTTPTDAGLPANINSTNSYKATVLALSARPAVFDPVHYSVEMSISFPGQQQVHTAYFLNPFTHDKRYPNDVAWAPTVTKLNTKFRDLKTNMLAKYPYFNTVPSVVAVKQTAKVQIFQMELPPQSGFYSTDEFMWQALRFPADLLEEEEIVRKGVTMKRYGFSNRTRETMVISSKFVLIATDAPDVMYELVTETPATERVFMEVEFFLDSVPQTLAEKKTLDGATASAALVRLITSGLLLLNLKPVKLAVDVTTPGRIVLQSLRQEAAEARMNITVRLPQPLKDYFLLESGNLTFLGTDARTVTLMHKEPTQQDPLANRYPLHLIAPGRAESHHYIDNFGYVTLLGILSGPSKFIGATEWVELRGSGTNQLRLLLVDRWCRVVSNQTLTEFYITLECVVGLF